MKHLKTFNQINELFGLFKKKSQTLSDEDEIVMGYIKRLERIEGISPYPIIYSEKNALTSGQAVAYRYKIEFGDTPIHIIKVKITDNRYNRFTPELKQEFIDKGAVFKTEREFYNLHLSYPVDDDLMANWKLLEELYNLTEKIYKEDKRLRKIQKIKDEINPAADLLDPDIY
jgi:hypothetical protein